MNPVVIDGSQGEGGGQILRTSVTLSCILGIPVKIQKIRAGREEPGLRPQHLQAVKSAAEIANSKLLGASVGSGEIELHPGEPEKLIRKKVDTGTAGSVTLIAQTMIPIALFRGLDLDAEIVGGTEVPASQSIDYLQKLVLPLYQKLGGYVEIQLKRRGYYPRGGGIIRILVHGPKSKMRALKFEPSSADFSKEGARILAVARNLPAHIPAREVGAAKKVLAENGMNVSDSDVDSSNESYSPGTSILIFRQSDLQYAGAGALGARGKSSEQVGSEAAQSFVEETRGSPNFDSHLSDMAVTLLSCTVGDSSFTTSKVTRHLETNLKVASQITGCEYSVSEKSDRGNYEVKLSGRDEKPI